MQRTISLKIQVPEGFLAYLEACNHIFNQYVDWCFAQQSTNKGTAHKELYEQFRIEHPEIPSAIIQTLRDTALESVKALKFKFKPFKSPHSHIRYDKRTVALRGNTLHFSWSGDRIKQIIQIPKFFQKRYGTWKFQAATIGYDRRKKCFKVNLIFWAGDPPKISIINKYRIVGIDRGLYNIVSLSDGRIFSSQLVRKNKRKFLFVKGQLQAKGTLSAKRKLRQRSGREKRFSLDVNHCISKWLVSLPYNLYVLEDLTGIRKQRKGKKINGWLANWTFYQLEQLLQYKAEAEGKQVAFVDARYTSQKCSNCGITDNKSRNKSKYFCGQCGHAEHADINAAKNIKNNHILSTAEKKVEQAPLLMCHMPRNAETNSEALARSN